VEADNNPLCPLSPIDFNQLDDLAKKDPVLADLLRQRYYPRYINPEQHESAGGNKTRWTAQELAAAEFSEPKWAVPGIVPVGFTFLAGRPKVGKSWLALQIAHAVGTGGQVMGVKVEKGNVFYLALEDNARRLKKRAELQHIPLNEASITFETNWKQLSQGGFADLTTELMMRDYRLIVIDTVSRALGGADQMDPSEMTLILGGLQQEALKRDIGILGVDHHRKGNGQDSDPIDDIWNSTAKAAVADGAIGLYRERGKRGEALLKMRGRDMEDKELALKWDVELCCWQSLGDASQVREETNSGKVYQALIALVDEGKLPTTDQVTKFTELNGGYVSRLLGELADNSKVKKGMKIGREAPYYPIVNGQIYKGSLE
jgi:hypothetical protein